MSRHDRHRRPRPTRRQRRLDAIKRTDRHCCSAEARTWVGSVQREQRDTMTFPMDLARRGLAVADVMSQSNSPTSAGIVRQLAALVVDQAAQIAMLTPTTPATGCLLCGVPLVQPATGRRRKFCSDEHRRQLQTESRRARNGAVARMGE